MRIFRSDRCDDPMLLIDKEICLLTFKYVSNISENTTDIARRATTAAEKSDEQFA
jgi:hypothetical protein